MRFKPLNRILSHIFFVLILSTTMTMVNAAYAESDNGADSKFTLRSLLGNYGFVIDGFIINITDNTSIPGAAVGRFTADGKGNITKAVRTLNSGGNVQEEIFTGTYTVNKDGTGTVTISVYTLFPDGSRVPATIETGDFVITKPRNELQIIGTSIKGPAGEELGLRLVTRGIARKQ